MRVGDTNSGGRPPVGVNRSSGSGAGRVDRKNTSSTSNSASAGKSAGGESANSELALRLKEIPEVRADVVAEVQQRLRDGELLTREAAEQTAAAILSDLQGVAQDTSHEG